MTQPTASRIWETSAVSRNNFIDPNLLQKTEQNRGLALYVNSRGYIVTAQESWRVGGVERIASAKYRQNIFQDVVLHAFLRFFRKSRHMGRENNVIHLLE